MHLEERRRRRRGGGGEEDGPPCGVLEGLEQVALEAVLGRDQAVHLEERRMRGGEEGRRRGRFSLVVYFS